MITLKKLHFILLIEYSYQFSSIYILKLLFNFVGISVEGRPRKFNKYIRNYEII